MKYTIKTQAAPPPLTPKSFLLGQVWGIKNEQTGEISKNSAFIVIDPVYGTRVLPHAKHSEILAYVVSFDGEINYFHQSIAHRLVKLIPENEIVFVKE